jgi:hypothetical protein
MDRSNHYESAFEAYLQEQRLCYVAIDERRRAILGETTVKCLDFIVYGPEGARLLIDIKGRRFPTGKAGKRRAVWECWSTQDDIDGLERWAGLFGPGYQGLLVFSYHVLPEVSLAHNVEDLWTWRGRRYLFRAVPASDYRTSMRSRSPRWGTVTLPRDVFRDLVRPLSCFTLGPPLPAEEVPF